MTTPAGESELRALVWEIVHRVPGIDPLCALPEPRSRRLHLDGIDGVDDINGIDAMLNNPVLRAEARRRTAIDAAFPAPPAGEAEDEDEGDAERDGCPFCDSGDCAEEVWRKVFVERSPLSETARAVLTSLGMLGAGCESRDLDVHRRWFAGQSAAAVAELAFKAANLDLVVMDNAPFDEVECEVWDDPCPPAPDPRYRASLRLCQPLHAWKSFVPHIEREGYEVGGRLNKEAVGEFRRWLADRDEIMRPAYWSLSMPARHEYDGDTHFARLLRKAVLPTAKKSGRPVFLSWGEPGSTLVPGMAQPFGGNVPDAVAAARQLGELAVRQPKIRFLATAAGEATQAALLGVARECANVFFVGADAPPNTPDGWTRITRMALESLGTGFAAFSSGARTAAELPGRWAHARWRLAELAQERYSRLWRTGWRPTVAEIEREIRGWLGGDFARFLGLDAPGSV